jgi:prolyl-tRNA editing enzyme YbaK/EbsC (Cys-tRNA(Pro) deacylase)
MTSEGSPRAIVLTRVKAIVEFLDGQGVAYELVEHESAMSAAGEARVAHLPTDQVAKTVLLLDGSGYVIATVSASARLDLRKVRELLGATRNLRLATEDEIARDFPTLEVGAIPPFGPWVPAAEVIDSALLEKERILCPAGDHRHSVLIDPREVVAHHCREDRRHLRGLIVRRAAEARAGRGRGLLCRWLCPPMTGSAQRGPDVAAGRQYAARASPGRLPRAPGGTTAPRTAPDTALPGHVLEAPVAPRCEKRR